MVLVNVPVSTWTKEASGGGVAFGEFRDRSTPQRLTLGSVRSVDTSMIRSFDLHEILVEGER